MTRALNQIEANFYRGMERVGGFSGKADRLNSYYMSTGTADYFETGSRALPRRDRGRGQGRRRQIPAEGSPRRAERRPRREAVKHASHRAAGGGPGRDGGGAEARPRQAARHRARAVAEAAGHPETEAVQRPRGVDRRASRGAARAGQPDRAFGQRRGSDRQVRRRQPHRRHARRRRRLAIVARPRRRARVPRREPHDDELV